MMSPLLLAPLLLLAQPHSQWAASLRTEARARSATPQDSGTAAAADAEVRPALWGALFSGPWSLTGGYRPTFRTREPYLTRRQARPLGDHSHLVEVEGVWAKEAAARAFLGQLVTYGTLDLSTVDRPPAGAGPAQPVEPVRAGVGLIEELTSSTSAGVDWYLGRTVTLTTTLGFLYGGGADAPSRASLPLQSTLKGAAKVSWRASPRDTSGFNLSAQYVRFFLSPATSTRPANPGARIVIGELSANQLRLLAADTSVDATVGVTGVFGQIPEAAPERIGFLRNVSGLAPLVAAGLSHRRPFRAQRLDLRLGAQLAPFVDRFAGTVYQRVEGNLGAGWTHLTGWSASLGAGVARSLPSGGALPLTTVSGDGAAGYAGAPWWRVDLAGRLSVVHSGAPAALERQWVVGLSVTLLASSDQPRTARE